MLHAAAHIISFGATDIGPVREHNEDAFRILSDKNTFILADGMGGCNAGEVAAQMAVALLSDLLSIDTPLEEAFEQVNTLIYQTGQEVKEYCGMGTTLLCLIIEKTRALFAHVGDSRLYRLHAGMLETLTTDHTLVHELGPSFPYKHILTKAIGTQGMQPPTINETPLEKGDIYLLCSDGLTNFVNDDEIESIVARKKNHLEAKAMKLIDSAKKNGGSDNITVILVEVHDLPRQ